MNYSKQRSIILNIVKSNPVHPTAEWVYNQARKEMPSIGLATVYRNLNALSKQGQIDRIAAPDGIDRYDGNVNKHFHMQCRNCGRLTDLKEIDNNQRDILKNTINTIFELKDDSVRICSTLITGICSECMKQEEKNKSKKTEE